MSRGKKLEVQLFGGTIERAKRSLGFSPFYEDSIVNIKIIYITKLQRKKTY